MPNIRLILWGVLAAAVLYCYQAWMHDYPAAGAPASSAQSAGPAPHQSRRLAAAGSEQRGTRCTRSPPQPPACNRRRCAANAGCHLRRRRPGILAAASDAASSQPLHVVTDVLDITINLKGGELDHADLVQYPLHKDTPHIPVTLLSRAPDVLYLLQTGLFGVDGEAAPTHLATWVSSEKSFVLAPGAKDLQRAFDLDRWSRVDRHQDLRVHPRHVFHRS